MTQTNYIERYWRDAKPVDLTKPQLMVARFKYYPDGFPGNWEIAIDLLGGFNRGKSGAIVEWFDSSGNRFNNAQVYDAPDPGEGWRLIDTANEKLHEGDEFLNKDGTWVKTLNKPMEGFGEGLTYRRRITPAVTYVPFTWEDREQLRGKWVYRIHANGTRDERILGYMQQSESGDIEFGGFFPDTLVREWKFLDTGKPVGKEVTQ